MKLLKRLITAILSLVLLSSCCSAGTSKPSYRRVNADQAAVLMRTESDYIILDVRTRAEYRGGHIPGAINVPNEEIDEDEILELPDFDQLILVYCRSGRRSKEAASKLAAIGYTNVVEFGGIIDWKGEIVSR